MRLNTLLSDINYVCLKILYYDHGPLFVLFLQQGMMPLVNVVIHVFTPSSKKDDIKSYFSVAGLRRCAQRL